MFLHGSFFGFNWVDGVFFLMMIGFIVTAHGFLSTGLEILSFIISLLFSYRFYKFFGGYIVHYFSTPRGIADAAGFFIAWSLIELVLYFATYFLVYKFLLHIHNNPLNKKLGFIAAICQGIMIYMFLISLIFALPVRGNIKQDILDSKIGPIFVNSSQAFQLRTKNVFGGAVSEALNFLTIEPKSNESVSLGFKLKESQLSVDEDSEQKMFELINKERVQVGLKPLVVDGQLKVLARRYATTMMENGFFSHVSQVDGSTPADRANRAGYEYTVLGENLAFAPDVYLAHQGLMNSPGHRANILGADYGKVGVGVIDGGVYGKMFVQEFSN